MKTQLHTQNEQAMTAICPFNHEWPASAETFNRGVVRSQGRRPRTQYETVVSIPECPTCHIRYCRLIPRTATPQPDPRKCAHYLGGRFICDRCGWSQRDCKCVQREAEAQHA